MNSKYRPHDAVLEKRADGTLLLSNRQALEPYAKRTIDWLEHWASKTPNAVFLAERSGEAWREVRYLEARDSARAIAAGLVDAGLDGTKPILILSGNSVNHGLLALAAQYVGVPIVPLAEQYALVPSANTQIDYVAKLVKPGLVYAEDGEVLLSVLNRDVFADVMKIVSRGGNAQTRKLSELMSVGGDISEREEAVTADTVAKILMTSGSTSAPKGVPTTHRMMCSNQTQIAHALPFLTQRPPVLMDWLPWNHVFGGSHNFNMMLANGGSLYIDGGKPIPALIGKTLDNLKLKTGTISFNVPAGFAMIRDELKRDAGLKRRYFRELDMLFYAGAVLPQDVWTDLQTMAKEVCGEVPLFTSSWGLTETAPAVLLQHELIDQSGIVGVPLPGCELKLIPDDDMRCEVRVRGPNLFSAYLNNPEQSKAAFDEEGFYKTGDAMVLVDAEDINRGLRFDGRLSEEFKLLTGTWVRAASLRLSVLAALGDTTADVVITGADRADIGVMIIPTEPTRAASDAKEFNGALLIPSMVKTIARRLAGMGGSSSTRIARAIILSKPLSMADGEVTAKGSLNFKKILTSRCDVLDRLYDNAAVETIVVANENA